MAIFSISIQHRAEAQPEQFLRQGACIGEVVEAAMKNWPYAVFQHVRVATKEELASLYDLLHNHYGVEWVSMAVASERPQWITIDWGAVPREVTA